MDFITQVDTNILEYIRNNMSCGALDWLAPKISFLANVGLIWIALGILLHLTKKYRRGGLVLLLGLLAGVLVCNVALKHLVARARPCWGIDISLLVPVPDDFSFPSGHTVASFIAATVLFNIRRLWGYIAFPAATLIALSRMYLYVHYPTDVICGALIGIAIALIAVFVAKRLGYCIGADVGSIKAEDAPANPMRT